MVRGQHALAELNGLLRATGNRTGSGSMGDGEKTSLTNDAYDGMQ